MIKILSILGSPRQHGNTAAVLDLIETHIQRTAKTNNKEIFIDRLNVSEAVILPCKGCRLCFDRGEEFCPRKDDLLAIKSRFDSADAILCSSPVYVSDVSGYLKTLIDRLAFVCHRPAFYGKSVYLIATTGGSPTGSTLNTLAGAFLSWGAHLIGRKGFTMGARMPVEQVLDKFEKTTAKIANKIFNAVIKDKASRPGFIELMIFKTQQNTWSNVDPDRIDYQYWKDHGWTERKVTYFIPHKTTKLIVGLSRTIGGILSRIWG